MRILHFSDVHVGVENYGRPATEADVEALPASFAPGVDRRLYLGLSTRLLDFLAAFDELVAFAVRERVDLVLFSGDAYKSRDPSQTHQREFARRVASLASHGIPVFLLVGNHDLPHARSSATALEIFPTLTVPYVTVAEQLETHRIETRSGPLQVVALPWPRWRNLLSRDQHRGKSVAELKAHVEAEITRRLLHEVERLDPAVPAVLSAHVTVLGATTGSERSMALGRDHVLQYGNVALPALDYVALGHVHKHQALGEWPPVVYSGSLQTVDFGEEKEDKGFCLVEIDPPCRRGGALGGSSCPCEAAPSSPSTPTCPPRPKTPPAPSSGRSSAPTSPTPSSGCASASRRSFPPASTTGASARPCGPRTSSPPSARRSSVSAAPGWGTQRPACRRRRPWRGTWATAKPSTRRPDAAPWSGARPSSGRSLAGNSPLD